jgi:hypothetical protein
MAMVPIHKLITREALNSFGFADWAIEIAEKADAEVDQYQGNQAAETNLHAMSGYFLAPDPAFGKLKIRVKPTAPSAPPSTRNLGGGRPLGSGKGEAKTLSLQLGALELVPDPFANMAQNYRLQTKKETIDAVTARLNQARKNVVKKILGKEYVDALVNLGEALHTVQDRVFHHFEPWPYKGIAESIMQSPNYMLCHVLRDTGYLSEVKIEERQFALGVALRAAPQTYVGVEGFMPIGRQDLNPGFRGWGGMVTLTLGAAPGSPHPGSTSRAGPPPSAEVEPCFPAEAVADKAQATDDSEEFVNSIKREVEAQTPGKWDDFVHAKHP